MVGYFTKTASYDEILQGNQYNQVFCEEFKRGFPEIHSWHVTLINLSASMLSNSIFIMRYRK